MKLVKNKAVMKCVGVSILALFTQQAHSQINKEISVSNYITKQNNTFIIAPQGTDARWVRDWGPNAVFPKNGKMKLGDGKYVFSTPFSAIACDAPLQFLNMDSNNQVEKSDSQE